jgi:hypothetical protein
MKINFYLKYNIILINYVIEKKAIDVQNNLKIS